MDIEKLFIVNIRVYLVFIIYDFYLLFSILLILYNN